MLQAYALLCPEVPVYVTPSRFKPKQGPRLHMRLHPKHRALVHAAQALEEAEEELKSTEAAAQVLGDREAPPEAGEDATLVPAEMTVAALQEALAKRGLDTKWNPLNKKKELVDRLSVSYFSCALLNTVEESLVEDTSCLMGILMLVSIAGVAASDVGAIWCLLRHARKSKPHLFSAICAPAGNHAGAFERQEEGAGCARERLPGERGCQSGV